MSEASTRPSLLWRAVIFVLIGVVLNLLVIWRIAYVPPDHLRTPLRTQHVWLDAASGRPWAIYIHHEPGITFIRADGLDRGATEGYAGRPGVPQRPDALPGWSDLHDPALRSIDHEQIYISEYAMGWPMRALRLRQVRTRDPGPNRMAATWPVTETRGAWSYTGMSEDFLAGSLPLPLIPIWPGLVVNTAFYALLAAALWLVPVRVMRRWRRRRNRCEHCGYPRGVSPVCTECGRPLPAGAAEG